MKISYTPVDMMCAPNVFAAIPEWKVTQGTAETLWLQLLITDAFGSRRYIPTAGSTLKLVFMRARKCVLGSIDTSQTFEVIGTTIADDRSLWSFPLTADNVNLLISGTVKLVLVSGTTTYTINKAFAIKKTLVSGGC